MKNYEDFFVQLQAKYVACMKKERTMEWKNLYSMDTYDHNLKVADGLFKSRAVQRPWLPNPEAILFVMQMGIDMGISPMIAIDKIRRLDRKNKETGHITPGGWMLEINLARSLVAKKGGRFEILEQDDKHIKTRMVRPDWEENGIHEETITLAELQKAGTAGQGSFKSYPKQIFRAAAFRQSCAVLFPDILHGTVVMDFKHENEADFVDTDESTESVSVDTVADTDVKPKRTRTRRTKAEIDAEKKTKELHRCIGEKEPVGASLVEETDYTLLKEAGYKFNDRDQCWVYHEEKLNMEPAEPGPLAPPAEKAAAAGHGPHDAPPPEDWDLGTNQPAPQEETAQDFDVKVPAHVEMLKAAADTCTWSPKITQQVKSNFLTFIEGKGIKATPESLKKGLEQCASQYLN